VAHRGTLSTGNAAQMMPGKNGDPIIVQWTDNAGKT